MSLVLVYLKPHPLSHEPVSALCIRKLFVVDEKNGEPDKEMCGEQRSMFISALLSHLTERESTSHYYYMSTMLSKRACTAA